MTLLNKSVAVVDDEYLIALGLSAQVAEIGLPVCGTAGSAEEAITLVESERPAVVLMDVRLGGDKDGVDAAIAIHERVGSKVIFVTGSREPETMARIREDHPAAVLFKPISDRQLRDAIETALQD